MTRQDELIGREVRSYTEQHAFKAKQWLERWGVLGFPSSSSRGHTHTPPTHLVKEPERHDDRYRDVQSPSPMPRVEERPKYHVGARAQVHEFPAQFRHAVPPPDVTPDFQRDLDVRYRDQRG